MDNAGGHGTKSVIEQYTKMLKDKYNIMIIHQVPRSPYTNLLDLGVWCSLQAHVEKQHYLKRTDVPALVNSVLRAWNGNSGLHEVISKVWGRLRNVMVLIEEDNGGNNLVEKKRGKQHRNLDLPTEFLTNGEESNTIDSDDVVIPTIDTYFDLEVDNHDNNKVIIRSI